MGYVPDRGEAVWINFDPQAGHEQSGRRPAFVLSPKAYNDRVGLVLLCPVTHQIKGYPFEVAIPNGLKIKGVILSDHIKNLDWKVREAEFICKLPVETMRAVLEKLKLLIF